MLSFLFGNYSEHIITGRNSAAKIVSPSFRNNDKIVVYERFNY